MQRALGLWLQFGLGLRILGLRLWDLGFVLYPVDKPGAREVVHLGFREA